MTLADNTIWASLPVPTLLLDPDDRIAEINPAAEGFLNCSSRSIAGQLVWERVMINSPLEDAFNRARETASPLFVNDVDVGTGERAPLHCNLQIAPLQERPGYMLFLISPRELAGRMTQDHSVKSAAKSAIGMGEMLAHEIKNPLTPIQLSAERIKRKFAPLVGEDRERLEAMTDVIVRQTGDLRRIVDEFSKFARMPEPDRREDDLTALVRDAVLLQQTGQPDVRVVADLPEAPVMAEIDATMMSQALTNLIKNAGEAIESLKKKGAPDNLKPEVRVTLRTAGPEAEITIADNGIGLPEDRARLFEPYVTTRDKGTGLGLPIVKKIIEEHGGPLILEDAPKFEGCSHHGAAAVIRLPLIQAPTPAPQDAREKEREANE